MTSANLYAIDVNDRVQRVEFAVRGLVGLLDALDILDDVQRLDKVDVQDTGITDQSKKHLAGTIGGMDGDVVLFEPIDKIVQLRLIGVRL